MVVIWQEHVESVDLWTVISGIILIRRNPYGWGNHVFYSNRRANPKRIKLNQNRAKLRPRECIFRLTHLLTVIRFTYDEAHKARVCEWQAPWNACVKCVSVIVSALVCMENKISTPRYKPVIYYSWAFRNRERVERDDMRANWS